MKQNAPKEQIPAVVVCSSVGATLWLGIYSPKTWLAQTVDLALTLTHVGTSSYGNYIQQCGLENKVTLWV